eukprot:scaffold46656_cov43-Phaeocystis_antarctica.AAC.1
MAFGAFSRISRGEKARAAVRGGRGPALGGFFTEGPDTSPLRRASSTSARFSFFWTFLCSLMSSIRTSKSRWTSCKTEACRCTGPRRPAAGVARR